MLSWDLSNLRHTLTPFYSHTGRPSVDPELMIRMRDGPQSGVSMVLSIGAGGSQVGDDLLQAFDAGAGEDDHGILAMAVDMQTAVFRGNRSIASSNSHSSSSPSMLAT